MHINILTPGKTSDKCLSILIDERVKRLQRYTKVDYRELHHGSIKSIADPKAQLEAEGLLLLQHIDAGDLVVILDERGSSLTSNALAQKIEQLQVNATRRLVCCIGGAHGFSTSVYERANLRWALSALTFTHEQARFLLAEQLYRAFTIIRHEPYHH